MQECPFCREELPNNAKFCFSCGLRIPSKKMEDEITNPEIRILYILMQSNGRSTFDRMMGKCGMCYGMFCNNADSLLEKGLIAKGKSFKDLVITKKGKEIFIKKAEKGGMTYDFFDDFED